MKDALRSLPAKIEKLEETKRLLQRLEAQEGKVSADRYNRLSERYSSQIAGLEEEIDELTDEGRTREVELEDRLAHQREQRQGAEAELEELKTLHADGALDEDTFNSQRRRYRRKAKQAKKKVRAHVEELEKLRFYLTEVGEVSYHREKLQEQVKAASGRVRQWSQKGQWRLQEWISGMTTRPRMLGFGTAVVFLMAAIYLLWPSGTEAVMSRGGPTRTGVYDGSGPKQKPDIKWRFETDGGNVGLPVVADGVVYYGSSDYNMYALDAETGQEQWRFQTEGRVYAAPAVTGGSVYLCAGLVRGGKICSVSTETGDKEWCFGTEDGFGTGPMVAGGMVYAASRGGILYALDAETERNGGTSGVAAVLHTLQW